MTTFARTWSLHSAFRLVSLLVGGLAMCALLWQASPSLAQGEPTPRPTTTRIPSPTWTATTTHTPTATATSTGTPTPTPTVAPHRIFLPLVVRRWPPVPDTPLLDPVANADLSNSYAVGWQAAYLATEYVLEEATDPQFTGAKVIYQGAQLTASLNRTPGAYYYRVRARNSWGDSGWSNVQSMTIYPLFVGLHLRWDGNGYIRGSQYYDVGYHLTRDGLNLTDPDTVRIHGYDWFSPNPYNWTPREWDAYYSVTTGAFRSSSSPGDPSWKWDYPWFLRYDLAVANGQTLVVDGQPFAVAGPHSGYTAFGKPMQYWRLVNTQQYLYWDGGGDWKQYVHAGEAVLHYDAGSTRVLVYDSILRRGYYKGALISDTVQYVTNLTEASSWPQTTVSWQEVEDVLVPSVAVLSTELDNAAERFRDSVIGERRTATIEFSVAPR